MAPHRKKLVLFVEGSGEVNAAPALVKRLLSESSAWSSLILAPTPFRVRGWGYLLREKGKELIRYLKAAAVDHRPLGGVLLLLDGDIKGQGTFCAWNKACEVSKFAREAGGGSRFSVATVFAVKEYETWLIAGVESLAGKQLPDGRRGVNPSAMAPSGNLEEAPRNAKGWLNTQMSQGYKPAKDQAALTQMVDLNTIRKRGLRSFRRLENALQQLVEAIRTDKHIVTPIN
jgi:Domain of unknown function (DUF4276)